MSDRINVGADPAWAGTFSNLVNLFDPKVAAEGATLLSKRKALDSEARYNTARAAGLEDQNSALGDAYLAAAGFTPQEIAAMRSARSNSVADIASGRNRFRGYDKIMMPGATDDDIRLGALALGIEKAGAKDFAGTSTRANDLIKTENDSELAKVVAGNNIDAEAKIKAAQIAAGATTDAAKIRASAGSDGRSDPNTQPFVTRDPAGDLSRLFGVTDANGNWIAPSEEEVVQPIMRTAQALIANGLATRENAIERAIAAKGYLPKKEVTKESSWGREVETTQPRPAKAPTLDASITEDGMDAGEIINIPLESIGSIKDPEGPVMKAPVGTIIQVGNIAYKRVPGGLQRVR